MDILEAMAIMTSTEKRIRRHGWEDRFLVYHKSKDRILLVDLETGALLKFCLSGTDLLTADWEIVD